MFEAELKLGGQTSIGRAAHEQGPWTAWTAPTRVRCPCASGHAAQQQQAASRCRTPCQAERNGRFGEQLKGFHAAAEAAGFTHAAN